MSEITYTKQGDYLIPDLTLPTEPEIQLGRYALMHRDYLEQHKRVTYLNLLTSGELNKHLYEVEQTALTRLELLTKQLCKEQGVTEELKEKAPMQWVGLMNNIRSQAEETILNELIYSILKSHAVILHDEADGITAHCIVVRVPTVIRYPHLMLLPQILCSEAFELFSVSIQKRYKTYTVCRFDLLFCIMWHKASFPP